MDVRLHSLRVTDCTVFFPVIELLFQYWQIARSLSSHLCRYVGNLRESDYSLTFNYLHYMTLIFSPSAFSHLTMINS